MKIPNTSILCRTLLLLMFSSAAEAAEPIPLRAGPLTMMFDADNAFLRHVKAGHYEVLRGINAPIRNQSWGTVRPKVSNIKLDDGGDHFSLTFDATCHERDIDFRWRGSISGNQKGEVEFTFDGVAHSTFLRNRIGFCVLHGPSAAGQPWIIMHVGGRKSKGRFPTFMVHPVKARSERLAATNDVIQTSARARQKGPPLPPSPSHRPQETRGEGRCDGEGGRGSPEPQ